MANVYCPACAAPLHVIVNTVVTITDRGPYGHGLALCYEGFLACEGCPLVTQVDKSNGKLIDLGGLTVADLQAPYVPGVEPAPYLSQQPTKLHGRRDS